jgi:hypothetical protein
VYFHIRRREDASDYIADWSAYVTLNTDSIAIAVPAAATDLDFYMAKYSLVLEKADGTKDRVMEGSIRCMKEASH